MPDAHASISEIGLVDFSAEPEVWQGILRDRWERLGDAQRRLALDDLRSASSTAPTADRTLGRLRDLMTIVDFRSLTPAEYGFEFENIVQQASDNPTLILFDKHLSENDSDGGLHLAIALYNADPENTVWAGILTNTVRKDAEGQTWYELSESDGIASERFILLSKDHLMDDSDTFVEALRVALMSRPASRLQRAVADSIGQAVASAQRAVSSIDAREFERIVFGLARDEGIWEIDVLLRLFDANLRRSIRSSLHGRQDLREPVDQLRNLDTLRRALPSRASLEAQRVYQLEIYEDENDLASFHMPVELGDLFKKENGSKHFVLVGQPCDLMVRNNNAGRRSPELSIFTLLPIRLDDPNASQSNRRMRRVVFELPAFNDANSAWVEIDRPESVPVEVLDYCVFSGDGRGFAPREEEIPDGILPAWADRGYSLAEDANKVRIELAKASSWTNAERTDLLRSRFGIRRDCVATPFIDGDNFNLGMRRVGRVRPPFARAILTTYASHLTRADFDRPLIGPP